MKLKQGGFALAVTAVAGLGVSLAGGQLAPAGASAPASGVSFQPLMALPVCVERRTPISALPYTIDRCGSYYVTRCLTGVAGQNGITVSADDVTIDLDGFTLTGGALTLDGIHVTGGDRRGVSIRGGIIREWGGDGVDGASGTSFTNEIHLERLLVFENAGHGINCGGEVRVLSCTANGNTQDGIVVGGGCVVRDNVCADNGRHGITAQNDGWIVRNFVDDQCSGSGILVTSGNTVVEDNVVGDCLIGIEITGPINLIVRNRVTNSVCGTRYVISGSGNLFAPESSDPTTAGPWANFGF